MWCTTSTKDKSLLIISIEAEKAIAKTQHSFMKKTLMKAGIETTYSKNDLPQTTMSITLKGENLKAFLLQECSLSPLLSNMVAEILATAIRERSHRIKKEQIEREEVKLSLYEDNY